MKVHRVALFALVLVVAGVAQAAPLCVPSCTVASNAFVFAPALVVVQDGATVTWTANDLPSPIVHTATDASDERCFNVSYSGANPGRATFRIDEKGHLLASTPGVPERVCAAALALPDGSFLLEYECLYHAQMTGFVHVLR